MANVKNKKEITYLKKSAKITARIFKIVASRIEVGSKEKDVVKDIERIIKSKGLRKSFRIIVASGPNAAMPHAKPTERRFKKNDAVVVDLGVVYKGYMSDMTRTFFLGKSDKRIKFLYKIVKIAQHKAIKKIKSGAKISTLVKEVNNYIRSKRLGEYIKHTLGHGIGAKIHESPKLSEKNIRYLKKGMVCTVEPGLYIKGLGGVRIEDMILIKDKNCEVLTK